MSSAYLCSGQEVLIDNKNYRIDRYIDNEIQLIEERSQRAIVLDQEKVLSKIDNGEIKFKTNQSSNVSEHIATKNGERIAAFLEFYSEESREEMKIKRAFIESLMKKFGDTRSQKQISIGIKALWLEGWGKAPYPSTVARWMKVYVEAGRDIRALCKANHLKGNREQRYDSLVVEKCQLAIRMIFLKPERGSLKKTLTEANRFIKHENQLRPRDNQLPFATISLLSSLIKKLPAIEVCTARYGRDVAHNKFRNAVNSVITSRPLERVEIDHTQLDIILVDQLTGLPTERPWLTLAIDHYSKCILGFSISHDAPSHMTLARVMKMALKPKLNIKKRWPQVDRTWPMFGLMQTIVVDNGFEFHGNSLEHACFMLGINIAYCPRKSGYWKAVVERAIGTLNRSVTDGQPGRTFSNIKEKGDYPSVKKAILSLEGMELIIAKWIVDIYHETVHDTLGKKPSSVWHQEMPLMDIPMVTNFDELDAVMGTIAYRKLSHKGIEINNLVYNSNELGFVREKFGDIKKLPIKWDPENLGYIHVLPQDGTVLKVPVIPIFKNYASGLSNYRHKLNKNITKILEEKNDIDSLQKANEMLIDISQKEALMVTNNRRQFHKRISKLKTAKSEPEKMVEVGKFIEITALSTNQIVPKFETKKSNRQAQKGNDYE
jgi:putative transposase